MKCALSLLPVPSHWLQRGVPGHTSTMDTAQRSQAPSQIAGLPHWIHCSNYTISCHYSCYLDLSSWSSREGWGWAGAAMKKRKGCSIQGSAPEVAKWSCFGVSGGETVLAQLVPCFRWEGFHKSASSLCACVPGVVMFLIFLSPRALKPTRTGCPKQSLVWCWG